MEIEGSRKRKRTPAAAATAEDRLSELPDCLLHDILSHLKARQVVQTCVLSRRWRHLWRSVPRLDVDCKDFWSPPPASTQQQQQHAALLAAEFARFEDFADNLLLRRSAAAPLDALRLRVDERCQRTTYGRWVRRAMVMHAPAALEVVRHYGGGGAAAPLFAALPLSLPSGCHRRLTRLCLDGVTLPAGFDAMLASGSGLPVLEDLELRAAHYPFARIASATLKKLAVERCGGGGAGYLTGDDGGVVVISAPRLSSLRLGIYLEPNWPAFAVEGPTPSLVEASIQVFHATAIDAHAPEPQITQRMSLLKSLCNLLAGISHVMPLQGEGNDPYNQAPAGQHYHNPDNNLAQYYQALPPIFQYQQPVQYYDIPLHPLFPPYNYQHPNWAAQHRQPMPLLQTMLDDNHGGLPVFSNLTTMVLRECNIHVNDSMKMLWRFLQNTPALEKLTLQNCKFSNGADVRKHGPKLKISSSLKFVDIIYKDVNHHDGEEDEYEDEDEDKDEHPEEVNKVLFIMSRKLKDVTVKVKKVDGYQ
uniref:F-box domain-containing protein n=1 Tax=Oryza rufipogon TaxID=4529 RepID=A0A0E0P9J4_ORYRU